MGRVALDQVSKRFDDVAAVDDLTLDVADEEFLVLLGPSGCGKSTALRMIAGLEDPTSGTITIGDRVVNDVEAKDRDVAMVFQSYALYPHMTVRRNIEFPLRSRKVPAAERATARCTRPPTSLGLGDAARPQARAAVRRSTPAGRAGPCDRAPPAGVPHGRAALEPRRQAAGADPGRAGRAAAAARGDDHLRHPRPGRGDDDGPPHRGPRATACCSRSAPPQDVYAEPANLFVARFIGSPPMNTVTGTVDRVDGALVVQLPGGRVPVPATLATAIEAAGARRGRGRRAARGPALRRRRARHPRVGAASSSRSATNATSCAGSPTGSS